ncbi:MAG TPA: RidA family protein [Saprospiraceae bacterium]|nr:RidA family protein [Saprospiraceae bacterium]
MNRLHISSGAKWEDLVGYSRAIRIGDLIEVSGTTAMKDGKLVGKDNLYLQTRICLEIIESALQRAGSSMHDVIRTRIYVTDITRWEEAGKAHGEFFGKIKPATAMVQVAALIDPDMLVEIEATALVSQGNADPGTGV